METAVGVRALRDGLTRYLGRVRRGDRVVVTDRGEPVAILLPYRRGRSSVRAARLAALLASGHVSPAARPFPPHPPLVRGSGKLPSDIIAESRR